MGLAKLCSNMPIGRYEKIHLDLICVLVPVDGDKFGGLDVG